MIPSASRAATACLLARDDPGDAASRAAVQSREKAIVFVPSGTDGQIAGVVALGEQGGRAKSGKGDRVRAKQRHLQPFALVAERLVCRTVFTEPLRRTVGREVPYQSEVPAPDLSIVGGLVDAEHRERITHHNRLRRAVGVWRGWLPSIAIATTA
jgi:hypothetical protein